MQTPSVYLADVRGRYKTRAFWTYDSVRNILGNRIYTGDTEVFKSHVMRVGSKRVRVIPEELRQVIPETHDAIISRSDYYLAHKVIKAWVEKADKWQEKSAVFLSGVRLLRKPAGKRERGQQNMALFLCKVYERYLLRTGAHG